MSFSEKNTEDKLSVNMIEASETSEGKKKKKKKKDFFIIGGDNPGPWIKVLSYVVVF